MIKYDQTCSPYTAKISIISPKVLNDNVSAAFLIEAILTNELTIKSLKKQSNVFFNSMQKFNADNLVT